MVVVAESALLWLATIAFILFFPLAFLLTFFYHVVLEFFFGWDYIFHLKRTIQPFFALEYLGIWMLAMGCTTLAVSFLTHKVFRERAFVAVVLLIPSILLSVVLFSIEI